MSKWRSPVVYPVPGAWPGLAWPASTEQQGLGSQVEMFSAQIWNISFQYFDITFCFKHIISCTSASISRWKTRTKILWKPNSHWVLVTDRNGSNGYKCKEYKKHNKKFCLITTILGGAKTKRTFLQEWWSFHLLDSSYNYRRKMWAI